MIFCLMTSDTWTLSGCGPSWSNVGMAPTGLLPPVCAHTDHALPVVVTCCDRQGMRLIRCCAERRSSVLVVVGNDDAWLVEPTRHVYAADEPDVSPGVERAGPDDHLGPLRHLAEHVGVRARLQWRIGERRAD